LALNLEQFNSMLIPLPNSFENNLATDRILLVENPADLNIDIGRLRIRRNETEDAFVAPSDVGILILHHPTIALSVSALRALGAAGACLMVTDETHIPAALMLPTAANRSAPSRLRRQIAHLDTAIPDALWQTLVQARIRTQSATLRTLELNGALRLARMAEEVEPGDRTHREGQAARHYWQFLFAGFKRTKEGATDGVNACLNYGYAVLHSLVARELVAAGLSCELGLGHRSMENPFNLADDFMEPYRFTVEHHIRQLDCETGLDSSVKKDIVKFVETEVTLGKHSYRLLPAVRETVASYVRILESNKGQLALPSG
jgi:CRISP-associated protein Cas1